MAEAFSKEIENKDPAHLNNSLQPHPSNSRFNSLKTDQDVKNARKMAIAKNTEKSTTWAVNIWKEWSENRQKLCPGQIQEWPIHLCLGKPMELNYWLSKFVLEARKEDCSYYPPNTLYLICCGLLRYVHDSKYPTAFAVAF